MNVRIQTQGFSLTPAIGAWVHEQMRSAVSRYADEIIGVDVFLRDLNGPRGGHDKQAVVRLHLRHNAPMAVTSTYDDLYRAIDDAARRAGRTVRKSVKRKRRIERRHPQHLAMASGEM
jgi:ribosomal subunit interface protein